MPSPTSRRFDARRLLRGAAGLLALAALDVAAGCSSLRDQAVPACPRCGNPTTWVGADGCEHLQSRLRLWDATPPDVLLGLGPWAVERPDVEAAQK